MSKVVSEDALRRALAKIDETVGVQWLQTHLDYCVRPLFDEPWVLDVDATIKPLRNSWRSRDFSDHDVSVASESERQRDGCHHYQHAANLEHVCRHLSFVNDPVAGGWSHQ